MVTTTKELELDPHRQRPWRADPMRFVRRVKGGKFQARPFNYLERTRVNLGLFHTWEAASKACRLYFLGQLQPRPKFVRPAHTRRGTRYFVMIPTAGPGGKRAYLRLPDMHETVEAAVAARDAALVAAFGRIAAKALLDCTDTSRRAGRY